MSKDDKREAVEPREWFIKNSFKDDHANIDGPKTKGAHVIEKSAFDCVKAQRDELMDRLLTYEHADPERGGRRPNPGIEKLRAENDRLKAEVEQVRESGAREVQRLQNILAQRTEEMCAQFTVERDRLRAEVERLKGELTGAEERMDEKKSVKFFTPKWFKGFGGFDCDGDCERAAHLANLLLQERGVRVYSKGAVDPWLEHVPEGISTHTALLVAIEPIKRDTLEDFIRDWLKLCEAYASQIREGPFQGFVDRARRLLASPPDAKPD